MYKKKQNKNKYSFINWLKTLLIEGVGRFCCAFFLFVTFFSNISFAQEIDIFGGRNSTNATQISSLMTAVSEGDVDGVKFFSRAGGFEINQQNIGGATALHIAARNGNALIIKILLENGADPNIVDNEGWTALMRAAASGSSLSVKILIAKEADAAKINANSESVIIHAALSGCSDCLNVIFTKAASIKNMDVKTLKEQMIDAFIIARNRDDQKTQKILEAYLDKINKMSPLIRTTIVAPNSDMEIIDNAAISSASTNSTGDTGKTIGTIIMKVPTQTVGHSSASPSVAPKTPIAKTNVEAPTAIKTSPVINTQNMPQKNLQPQIQHNFKFISGQPSIIMNNGASNDNSDKKTNKVYKLTN